MNDGNIALVGARRLESGIALEDIDKGMLPVCNRVHAGLFKLQRCSQELDDKK